MGNGGVERGDGCCVPWRAAEGPLVRAGHRQGMGCQPLAQEQRQSHRASGLGSPALSPGVISLSWSLSEG